jgi:hypothetical protein
MPLALSPEAASLLNDDSVTKILVTVDADGVPHAVVKRSLQAADGKIRYLELIETSTTNRNLVRSIWFDGIVSVLLASPDGRSLQIKGRPVKNHISGPLFLEQYQRVRALYGDVDLAGVWEIEADAVIDQSIAARHGEETARHPTFIHLDRIARAEVLSA